MDGATIKMKNASYYVKEKTLAHIAI